MTIFLFLFWNEASEGSNVSDKLIWAKFIQAGVSSSFFLLDLGVLCLCEIHAALSMVMHTLRTQI